MSITSRGQSTDSGRKPSGPGAWRFATSFPGPRPLYQANLDQAAPEQGWSALPCAAVILGRSGLNWWSSPVCAVNAPRTWAAGQ